MLHFMNFIGIHSTYMLGLDNLEFSRPYVCKRNRHLTNFTRCVAKNL